MDASGRVTWFLEEPSTGAPLASTETVGAICRSIGDAKITRHTTLKTENDVVSSSPLTAPNIKHRGVLVFSV